MTTNGHSSQPALLLAGCGSLGSAVALQLMDILPAGAILGLVDPDVVEPANLVSSPAYDEADVGRPKVHALAAHLRARRAGIEIIPLRLGVEELGAGPFRQSTVVLGALDNHLAKFRLNRDAQAAGVPYFLGELDGGGSDAYRLRYWNPQVTRGAGPCLECAWSDADYSMLATLAAPCARMARASSGAQAAPAQRLAAVMVDAVASELVGLSLMRAGEERRVLPEQAAEISLHAPGRRDCFCPHGRPAPFRELPGSASSFTVGDLIGACDEHFGQTRWTWRLPAAVRPGRCEDCGAATGWSLPTLDCPPVCPACHSPHILRGSQVAQLGRAELLLLADRPLVELWPAGDIVEVSRSDGRKRRYIGLPVGGLWDWLSRHETAHPEVFHG